MKETSFNESADFPNNKATDKQTTYKPICTGVERLIKNTDKKLAAFQKDARKSPAERRVEIRDVTPARSSGNRSISPAERKTQENLDLKDQLKKTQEERDILKAWKENVLKLPGNFSEDPNSIYKEHEICKKQLLTRNKVLTIKIQTMATSFSKFLKETSVFQKTVREKEGFSSLNFYENEKSKLEVKIKELADLKEISSAQSDSPCSKQSFFDISHFTEKILACESENKILKNQLREAKKNVKTLEIKCAELDNFRWQAEKEKIILERKSKTPADNKKNFLIISRQIEAVKNWAESRTAELSKYFEGNLEQIIQKVAEKERSLAELRNRFTENLKENLNLLITMNENMRNPGVEKSCDEVLKSQVENFEFIIEQHKAYTEIKVRELNETIESLEKERNRYMKSAKMLENENLNLRLEINKYKDLELSLQNSKGMILELEEINKVNNSRLRIAKQKEIEIGQIQYEKDVMAVEIRRLNEEIAQRDKIVIELQDALSSEQILANKYLEDLVFDSNATKTECELLKIELSKYKSDLEDLEKTNCELEDKLNKVNY